MPLKLSVGLSKKVGQPDFGSLGASCHVELELDGSLLKNDPEAFHRQLESVFAACTQAVDDELARHRNRAQEAVKQNGDGLAAHGPKGHASKNGRGGRPSPRRWSGRSTTASQVKAILAIARSQDVDLAQILQDRYQVGQPEDLSLAQASELIGALQSLTNEAKEDRTGH